MSRHKHASAAEIPAAVSIAPLCCPQCGAPVAVGATDDATCARCGTRQQLPEAYRALRDARRMSDQDAQALDAVCAEISRPSPPWKRVASIVGYAIGILTLVILALGALIGTIVGLVAASELGADGKFAAIVVGIIAFVLALMSVPFVGEYLLAYWTASDGELAWEVATSAATNFRADATVGFALYAFSLIPIALAMRASTKLSAIAALQSRLAAARPAALGGACACRRCGAPLENRDDAIVVRCLYCATDNLVTVPTAEAKATKEQVDEVNQDITEALRAHSAEVASTNSLMWGMVLFGPLLMPVMCAGGWLLHKLATL